MQGMGLFLILIKCKDKWNQVIISHSYYYFGRTGNLVRSWQVA